MKKSEAENLVNNTFTQPYDEARFRLLIRNLFHAYESLNEKASTGQYIPDSFKDGVVSYKRLAKFTDPEGLEIDVLAVQLSSRRTLENARTMQRNFIARYLNGSRGGQLKDAALVAFYSDDCEDWRFSLVKMDYELDTENQKLEKTLTPARRYSFLVGKGETTHTVRSQLLPVLTSPAETTLLELETAFNIETVTKEFFEQYKALYLRLKDSLDHHLLKDPITKKEFKLKGVETPDFAKRLLGQIVFLYFLQKKGWLGVPKGKPWGSGPKDFLQKLYKKELRPYENFFNDILEHLFYDALATERQTQDYFYPHLNCKIPFLNGGLFEPFKDYAWDNTDILLDNAIFDDVFKVFDTYNFTVREDEPLDKEVAIDPEMLGKVFENLIPENERKGSGTYYTPREIVHYMCQESLINYLDAKLNIQSNPIQKEGQKLLFGEVKTDLFTEYEDTYVERVPKADLAEFIHHGDVAQENDAIAYVKSQREDYKGKYQPKIPESVRSHAKEIDDALADVRVCDPAIGSGAFPVGVMAEIVRARLALNAYLGEKSRTAYDFKRHAIQESIYGVDIEPSAVDIAKLRLWLSLVVDETDFGIIKPLPNLDYKIMVGNSLLGVEKNLFNHDGFKELEVAKHDFFDETRPSEKAKLRTKIDTLIKQLLKKENRFSFEICFSEIFRQCDGFDISIANPPYVFARDSKEKGFTEEDKKYFYNNFTLAEYQLNLYPLFIELSTNTLKRNGTLCYITPNNWMTINTNTKVRKLILDQSNILLVNFYAKVFESASVDSSIIIFRKGEINNNIDLYEYETGFKLIASETADRFKKERSMIINIEALRSNDTSGLIRKIESNSQKLAIFALVKAGLQAYEVGKGQPIQTKEMKDVRVYHSVKKESDDYVEYLDGKDVCRYYSKWSGEFLKYGKNLASPRNVSLFNTKRILVRQIPSKPPYCINACYFEKFVLNDRNSMNIVRFRDDPFFILAVLNSKPTSYWFVHKFGKMQRGTFPQFKINELEQFPIPKLSADKKSKLADWAKRLLDLHAAPDSSGRVASIAKLENNINQLLYEFYELTPDEIGTIEG